MNKTAIGSLFSFGGEMKRKAIVSVHMRDSIKCKLSEYYDIHELYELNSLPKPTAAHPDMQLLKFGDTLVRARGTKIPFASVESDKIPGDKYPRDVVLNACLAGDVLFAKVDSLDPAVKRICEEKGISIINVSQGYAKCSTLVISKNAVISADKGIVKAAACHGLDTLLITPGNIKLEGYDYGFIGGASHYDKDLNQVFFYGDISKHPDASQILSFIEENGAGFVCCDDGELTDYGGAVLL